MWLRLQHRHASSIALKAHRKLAPRFYGPYKILARIGDVAYQLELPARARICDVFHVGLLEPYFSDTPSSPPLLPDMQHGRVCPSLWAVVHARLARDIKELLVRWQGSRTPKLHGFP